MKNKGDYYEGFEEGIKVGRIEAYEIFRDDCYYLESDVMNCNHKKLYGGHRCNAVDCPRLEEDLKRRKREQRKKSKKG